MAQFVKHPVFGEDRKWPQYNCSLDSSTGVIYNWGYNPIPLMAICIQQGYAGDQFDFVKFSHSDLEDLLDIITGEVTIWRTLELHIVEQLKLRPKRVVMAEVDAYNLADTAGVTYHREHKKTGIIIDFIDPDNKTFTYYHNDTYSICNGDDYDGALALHGGLVAYCEYLQFLNTPHKSEVELRDLSKVLLKKYINRIPADHPIKAFREVFPSHMSYVTTELFHEFAFNNYRMLGANYEWFGTFLKWLGGYDSIIPACNEIAQTAKVMQFRGARMVAKKRFDPCDELFDTLEKAYDTIVSGLK